MTQSTQIQTQPQNSKAVASLVSGIVAWVLNLGMFAINSLITLATVGIGLLCVIPFGCIVGLLPLAGWLAAIITGHLSLGEIKQTGQSGRGMAITGLVLGYLGLATCILTFFLVIGLLIMGVTIPLASLPFLTDLFNQLNQYQWYIPYH